MNAAALDEWHDRSDEERCTELNAARVKDDGGPDRYFWTPGAGHLGLHWEHLEAALKENATP